MGLLTREQILGAADQQTIDVEVPEWGGTVRVRSLTAGDRDRFEQAVIAAQAAGKVGPDNVRARYVAACVVDEAGKPLFTDKDLEVLAAKSFAAMDRVFAAATKLNAFSAADIEELAKN
ncbi:MAG: hypothetical protein INF91_05645 [Alphaproteobacteria bacterium]|nr:hypothetical protein [Alphaproteobacteria bacterium]